LIDHNFRYDNFLNVEKIVILGRQFFSFLYFHLNLNFFLRRNAFFLILTLFYSVSFKKKILVESPVTEGETRGRRRVCVLCFVRNTGEERSGLRLSLHLKRKYRINKFHFIYFSLIISKYLFLPIILRFNNLQKKIITFLMTRKLFILHTLWRNGENIQYEPSHMDWTILH
jgi:hypothetical protein